MLCVIKEIYSVYTSFICNCTGGFYSLKLWFIWTFTSQTHKFQLHLKGHRLKQLPHLNRSPTKKSKTLIPHPSPVLMRSSDESKLAVKVEGLSHWNAFPLVGKLATSSLGKAMWWNFQGTEPYLKMLGRKPPDPKKSGEVRIFGNLPETPRGCIQLLHVTNQWWIPEVFPWVVNPWGPKQLWMECYNPYIDGLIDG